jgi:hypothetical protein
MRFIKNAQPNKTGLEGVWKRDWSYVVSSAALGLIVVMFLILRIGLMVPPGRDISPPTEESAQEATNIAPLIEFPNTQRAPDGARIAVDSYFYDFDHNGTIETLRVTQDRAEAFVAPAIAMELSYQGRWLVVPHSIVGAIQWVRLLKPYDIVVIEAASGKYLDSYYFKWLDGEGLRPIPIIDGDEQYYGLGGSTAVEYVESTPHLPSGMRIFYFPRGPQCEAEGYFYQLMWEPAPKIVKTWNMQQTPEACESRIAA